MEAILLDIPDQLTTERLMLRAPRLGDGAMINPCIVESAAELARWMPWARPTPDVDNSEKWCRSSVAKFVTREQLDFLIFLREPETYVGTCSLHRIDWNVPKAEIGYWLRTPHCGHGYVSEATKALTDLAFQVLKMHRVEIRCDAENRRSRRVAELAGFKQEGILRNETRENDKLRDTCIFSSIPE